MFEEIIAIIISIICIFLGISPREKTGGGKKEKILTDGDYNRKVTIAPFSTKFATGDLTQDYPQGIFVGNTTGIPKNIEYTGPTPTRDVPLRHWGQRKLLLTEIDFLNRIPTEKCTVIYAGAADGRHISILLTMYPHVTWHLYDPRAFYPGLDKNENIKINPYYGGKTNRTRNDKRTEADLKEQFGWFTDEVAEWYAEHEGPIYFVSDIRTVPLEEEIEKNQQQQQRWIRTMRPLKSMFKYRVPYAYVGKPRTYHHIAGPVRLQCWAPIHSAETRIIVDCPKGKTWPMATWDTLTFERNLAWYNQVMRTHDFSQARWSALNVPIVGTVAEFWRQYSQMHPLGFDYVYELQIIRDYIKVAGLPVTADEFHRIVREINATLISPGVKFDQYLRK